MIAFDVRLNGKKLCRAGTPAQFGVITERPRASP
jgi:hypothetical protein